MTKLKQIAAALTITIAVNGYALSSAQAETTTLRMAHWLPQVHHLTDTLNGWVAVVKKESGGTLIIKIDKGPVAKPPGMYDVAKSGIRDLAWGVAGYTPGRFALIRAVELPFLSTGAEVGSAGLWDWYSRNKLINREFSDTKLITVWVHGPGVIHTKKPVMKLEDLRGMKLRVGGGGVGLVKLLGAVPVPMSATKAHESLRLGTTSGTLFPFESIKGFRLAKLVRNHLEVPGGIYTSPFFLTMNMNSWSKLSAKHKAVLMKVGGAWGARYIGKRWDIADAAGRRLSAKNGNKIRTLAPAELKRWRVKLQPMHSAWIGAINKKGLDGAALLKDLRATIAKHGK